MTPKPVKTAADYMAVAVCPALIMVLVGSLVFFLIQIGYSGDWIGRLRWTLFWFVFAMVLVSRIAIEQSAGAAFLYGLALAFATSVMLTQYLGFLWGVWLLLALIWWTCTKIVWDCTFIDDDQDASGQGLLQISRLDRWTHSQLAKVRAVPPSPPDSTTSGHQASPSLDSPSALGNPLPRRLAPQSSIRSFHSRRPAPRSARRPQELHAPGLWVLYFSLAAVPVFGLGELLLDSKDSGARRFCFVLLFAYLSAALCLLLLTSFLGLRRYLRQRYLVMPPAMAGSWVSTGLALVVGVMLLALLLPRPATPYSLAAFVTKLGSPAQKASQHAPDPQAAIGNPQPRSLASLSSSLPTHPRRPAPRSAHRRQELHAPGLWVLYFSFAAVPVFGLGELLLNSKDSGGRSFCFALLFAYLSAALGLLLLTSFLGLRRYLRQRYLVMPPAMAGSWVSTGVALIVGVLLLALLLPRPATPYSLAAFVTKLGSPAQKPSQRAPETSEGAEGQSHSQVPSKRGAQKPESTVSKDQQPGQSDAGRGKADGPSGSPRSSPSVSPPSPNLAIHVEKWLSYLVVGLLLLVAVFRFWPEISAGVRSLLESLSSLWPARRRKKAAPKHRAPLREPSEAIALLPNPFQTGLADQMSTAELVRYSYNGLRAWAQSRGFTPKESETPLELAERLSQSEGVLSNEILLLGSYYSHVAYAGQPPAEESLAVLKRLWSVIGPAWKA
jgi:hypothetical protein